MSQDLLHSWVVESTQTGAIVGTRVSYAAMVQKEGVQQPMHEDTGWKTDVDAVQEVMSSGAIGRIATQQLDVMFGGMG